MKSKVSIVKTVKDPGREEIFQAVSRAVEMVGGLPKEISAGKKVLINPNLVDVGSGRKSATTTHPDVCRAVADLVKARGAVPIIADSASAGINTGEVIEKMGYTELIKDGYQVLDLKKTPKVKVHNPNARIMPDFEVFSLVQEADVIISVPVMKTHAQTEVTLSIKNLKGLLTDISKKEMHQLGVFEGVPELLQYLKPSFAIIDGIYAQEGLGPIFGSPVEMDLILASSDLVALDCIGGMVMGFKPEEVFITSLAAKLGLGTMRISQIEVIGEKIEKVYRRFKRTTDDDILGEAPPFQLLFQENTCSGCRNTVMRSLINLKREGLLSHLKDKVIIAGTISEIPVEVLPKNLVLVGNCARKYKKQGRYVHGCPPLDYKETIDAIIGEPSKC